ncbi:MAG: response regulator [Burkholderiales bacterium]|nr:response regulator [Burkholderiales bacterium]
MSSRGRILVVDDDRLVLATVVHGLVQAGFEVIDADNGDDAILLAREHRPELALLDIRMEGKTGFDVAEYLRDVAHVPFIFLSAFADADTRAKVESLGALAYLVKPLDVGRIVPTVERAIAQLRAGTSGSAGAVSGPADGAAAQPAIDPARPVLHPAPPTGAAVDAGSDPVPVAVGILMHRFSLTRAQAAERLARLAADKAVAPLLQAQRLIDALEELAGTARD